ncbi:MAG: sugar phosphate isomerase/epimerase family protein [Planctomycetota bacterium]
MQLGFVSAILPDLSLAEVAEFAATVGFQCVELMCWPRGKAERRYAGVTHVDVTDISEAAAEEVRRTMQSAGVSISSLGYYPNYLAADAAEGNTYAEHFKHVIRASAMLEVNLVTTFIGRDPRKTVDENWPRLMEVWPPILQYAAEHGVRVGIENCPMYFTKDEWPSGKNLAYCPAVWKRLFEELGPNIGLNYDPSHLVWMQMDWCLPVTQFRDRLFHLHAKDVKLDREKLNQVGILATPLEFHQPKLPGLGEIDWRAYLAAVRQSGYDGPLCIEVEDRDFEGSLDSRKQALRQSAAHLRQCMS